MADIDYSTFVNDLQAKRSELERSILAIDAAIAGAKILNGSLSLAPVIEPQQATPPQRINQVFPLAGTASQKFKNMTIPQAVELALRDFGKPMSTRDVHNALVAGGFETKAANFFTTIGSVLTRHSKEVGRVRRLGNAWGLAEWDISPDKVA